MKMNELEIAICVNCGTKTKIKELPESGIGTLKETNRTRGKTIPGYHSFKNCPSCNGFYFRYV
jgi:hypothetical protein